MSASSAEAQAAVCTHVAGWAYEHAERLAQGVWLAGRRVERLSGEWRRLLLGSDRYPAHAPDPSTRLRAAEPAPSDAPPWEA